MTMRLTVGSLGPCSKLSDPEVGLGDPPNIQLSSEVTGVSGTIPQFCETFNPGSERGRRQQPLPLSPVPSECSDSALPGHALGAVLWAVTGDTGGLQTPGEVGFPPVTTKADDESLWQWGTVPVTIKWYRINCYYKIK